MNAAKRLENLDRAAKREEGLRVVGRFLKTVFDGVGRVRGVPTAVVLAWGALGLFAPGGARGQSSMPREETCVTNGPVLAIARTASTVYIGGEFSYVGPYTGGFVPISASTGQPVGVFPRVNGFVYACVPDGAGGWFIGGEFTKVGGVGRNNIAHIRADGSVDTAWNPNANNRVFALAISGSTVYAGGQFWSIGGQTRHYFAQFDPLRTGVKPSIWRRH